jgi:NAD(P)-dependent dehydrogenase (short-subunit alcohol dehydrogenase family)
VTRRSPPPGRVALVTGTSKGIGEACVRRLATAGWHVYAGVRGEADAERWRGEGAHNIVPLLLDVTDAAAIEAAARFIGEQRGDGGLDAVINNAGAAFAGPLEILPIAALRHQLEVNVIGQIAVTQAVLPLIRAARGRIIFMSSTSGRSALPLMGAYAASKFALEAAADALRVELRPWRIPVTLIEPGVIETPIWQTSLRRAQQYLAEPRADAGDLYGRILAGLERRVARGIRGLPADAVARVVERALNARRPRARYVMGRGARARLFAENVLPTRWRDALVAYGLKRTLGSGARDFAEEDAERSDRAR